MWSKVVAMTNDFWNGAYYKEHAIGQRDSALALLEEFPLQGTERILDVGCGTGGITKVLADRAAKGVVVGIDPSAHMLEQATGDYGHLPHVEFVRGQVETMAFARPFDVIVSFYMLHFVRDHLRALQRMHASLHPGGRILFLTASQLHPAMAAVCARAPWREAFCVEERFFPLALDRAEQMLERAGFTSVEAMVPNRVRVFPSAKSLAASLMTWIRHVARFSEERTLELAQEIAEECSCQQGSEGEISFEFRPLIVKAHRPN